MKVISLDSWAADGKRFIFEQEYDVDESLIKRFPNKFKVTSELKTQVESEIKVESVEQKPLEIKINPKKSKRR